MTWRNKIWKIYMQDSKGSKVSFIFNVPNIPFRERTKLFPIFLALLFFYRVQTGVPNFINPSNGIPRIFRDVGARKQQPSLRDKKKLLWYTEYSLLRIFPSSPGYTFRFTFSFCPYCPLSWIISINFPHLIRHFIFWGRNYFWNRLENFKHSYSI